MEIQIKDIQKDNKERREAVITVRTYPSYANFMQENDISPSKLFNKALESLMKKIEKKEKEK